MPLTNESYDSLPYVDTHVDDAGLAAARAAILADLSTAGVNTADLHPALAPAAQYTPRFSDLVEREHARLDANPASRLSGIDVKRYEDLDAPESTGAVADEDRPAAVQQWNRALTQAHTSAEYVQGRLTQLGLLEKFGKNAWLVGNAQLEDLLRGLEADLVDVRGQHDDVATLRRTQQEAVLGEIKTLEHTWKQGLGRVLETEVAAEALKQQILDRRRAGAV
ncbi:uncharacterized protein M421DRAFT_90220 [Didymella exigua CBS 183.55]|uniref:Breast carcinoma amplified sequence 2 n=1 Tax=Didymella exigua CBS 183.55 TaxID=1150837 RepID=A0A6A5RU95_9PLEO|nr:uncharacterized protein M421DRAFT_90220 [Didymella exigua CBS 183.55]KAF1931129.1 hypothetical protein M421DRAFT_90220 [Didymella exigua CBS 183.55]